MFLQRIKALCWDALLDYKAFERLWEAHKTDSAPVPGTIAEAVASLQEINKYLSRATGVHTEDAKVVLDSMGLFGCGEHPSLRPQYAVLDLLHSVRRHQSNHRLSESDILGDARGVSYLFMPSRSVGYEVTKGRGNVTKEHFEGLRENIETIRKNGKLVAVHHTYVMRMESRGNVHIM